MTEFVYFIIFCVELFHFSIGYVNLAVHKPAWQTTNYSDTCCFASAVVDNNTSQNFEDYSCAIITATKESGEWRVDLGKVLSIYNIRIYYRNDAGVNTWRMAGFFLYVSNTTNKEDGHLCFHEIQTSIPPNPMTITCIQHARYVIYYNERNNPDVTYPSSFSTSLWNELCEVQVYGCSRTGVYGINCNKTCPSNCKNTYCDIVNGDCLSCIGGYQGQTCNQECPDGTYGLGCKKTCSVYCKGTSCNHVDGKCDGGCKDGWTGNLCNTVCPISFYGENCGSQCGHCYNATTCNHIVGTCPNGCTAGWLGMICKKVCDNHYYGPNCALGCGKCWNRQTCNHINGTCSNGCDVGWQGDKCFSECSPGTFGLGCTHLCSNNCYGNTSDLCHAETGNCINGCLPGWQGENCDQACHDFFYGENCGLPCGRCFGGEKCKHVDGGCKNGCVAGVQGYLCNKLCDPGKYGQGCNQTCNENCNGTHNTCDLVTGECIYGCKTGSKGRKCDGGADIGESAEQPQELSQQNTYMIGAIVGWVIIGILIASLIICLILYKLRKIDSTKDNRKIYDDINMERRDESHVYSSVN